MKASNGWSDKVFNEFLQSVRNFLPNRKDDATLEECRVCGSSRYKRNVKISMEMTCGRIKNIKHYQLRWHGINS
jgi:hypothetical protein